MHTITIENFRCLREKQTNLVLVSVELFEPS